MYFICFVRTFCFCENGWGDGAAAAAAAAAAALGAPQIAFFVIVGPNGDFHEEIMKGKRPFGARFGFACFRWGSLRLFVCFTFFVQMVIIIKRL